MYVLPSSAALYAAAQYWGGSFYFLNKVFFWLAERASTQRRERVWRIAGWTVYPIGMPGWLYVFAYNHNWIAGSVEAAGIFGMILGLANTVRGVGREPRWLNWTVRIAMVFGLAASVYDFGGITRWNQVLEILLNTGFFFGVYLLGKKRPSGYLWFLLMLGSNATLQYIQGAAFLVYQQVLSMVFIADAYRCQRRKSAASS